MRWTDYLLTYTCLLACGSASAADAPTVQQDALQVEQDAEVLALIDGLAGNQAALLPDARVVGLFNEVAKNHKLDRSGPRGRDYCKKMVWAPERRRALFCGANHAVPHRLNDVWEFDLGANAWIMLYAPDPSRSYTGLGKQVDGVTLQDGWLRSERGGPVRIGHSWWGIAYDAEQRKLYFMNTWVTKMDQAVERIGADPADRYPGPPLWSFDPATGRWEPIPSEEPWPRAIFGGMLEYIPEYDGLFWHGNN